MERGMKKKILALVLISLVLLSGSIVSPVASASYSTGDEIVSERGRSSRTYYIDENTLQTEFFGSPEFTQVGEDWVDYAFTDKGDHYQVQHPWSPARFYDYHTEVWNEEFTEVKIYDDRWTVEYQNKQGNWIDADFYNVERSYEVVSDGIQVKRTGNTDIGQREEIYHYRNGSPCKIEIIQTCNEAQTIRFIWKPSGIVADTEREMVEDEFSPHAGKVSGLNYYDSTDKFVQTIRWYNELGICDSITPVVESHAEGRKATVTFGGFAIDAGGMAHLDPDTFYSSASDGLVYRIVSGESWDELHDAPNGTNISDVGDYLQATTRKLGTNYYEVVRSFLFFPDTSNLGPGAAISAADLTLYNYGGSTESQAGHADMGLFEGVQDEPLELNDYGDHLLKTTLGLVSYYDYNAWGAENTKALNATGIGWINKTGTTEFCLRCYGDVNDLVATGYNKINACSSEKGNGFKPKLVVTYTLEPDISGSIPYHNFGVVLENETHETGYANSVTNQSGAPVSLYIKATDWDGGNVTWVLSSDGNPGEDIMGMKALVNGEETWVVMKKTDTLLYSGLADESTITFKYAIYTPTVSTETLKILKESDITVTAVIE